MYDGNLTPVTRDHERTLRNLNSSCRGILSNVMPWGNDLRVIFKWIINWCITKPKKPLNPLHISRHRISQHSTHNLLSAVLIQLFLYVFSPSSRWRCRWSPCITPPSCCPLGRKPSPTLGPTARGTRPTAPSPSSSSVSPSLWNVHRANNVQQLMKEVAHTRCL